MTPPGWEGNLSSILPFQRCYTLLSPFSLIMHLFVSRWRENTMHDSIFYALSNYKYLKIFTFLGYLCKHKLHYYKYRQENAMQLCIHESLVGLIKRKHFMPGPVTLSEEPVSCEPQIIPFDFLFNPHFPSLNLRLSGPVFALLLLWSPCMSSVWSKSKLEIWSENQVWRNEKAKPSELYLKHFS